MVRRTVVSLESRRGRAVGELIRAQITSLLEFANSRAIRISAIGIAVPGIVNPKTGTVWAPNIEGWQNYPLRREIQEALRGGRSRVARSQSRKMRRASPAIPTDVVIESDRACYILGESWRGAAKGCRNAIFLAVGTGIGAGIIAEGRVLHGVHGIAGAVGWLALDPKFRKEYSQCGCFEFNASGEGLAKSGNELLDSHRPNDPRLRHSRRLTTHDVFAAYDRRDPVARAVIGRAIRFWGMAVANLVSIFNPEKIIFGGGVFGPARRFLPDIRVEAKKWAQPISMKRVKLQVSKLGADAGLFGAAYSALHPV
jgi:glucokinase